MRLIYDLINELDSYGYQIPKHRSGTVIDGKLHGKHLENNQETYFWYGREVTKQDFENRSQQELDKKLVLVYINGSQYSVPYSKVKEIQETLKPYQIT